MDDMHDDEVDFEDEIEKFTLRVSKAQASYPPAKNYKKETDVIPLLIKDVHQLKLSYKIFEENLSAYGIPFSSTLLYGRIYFAGAGFNSRLRYYLDDGTGIIKLRLLQYKSLSDISQLASECSRIFGHNKELLESAQNILKATRTQLLDTKPIPNGTKVLIIGRPHKFFEEIVFTVFEMIIDDKPCRDLEIAVKTFLIQWYSKKYYERHINNHPQE